jgi:hypothetical protein
MLVSFVSFGLLHTLRMAHKKRVYVGMVVCQPIPVPSQAPFDVNAMLYWTQFQIHTFQYYAISSLLI